jgi:signal transduction histidine kinase
LEIKGGCLVGQLSNKRKSKIGTYLARHHILLSLMGLCAVAIVQWRLFAVVDYQGTLNKDQEALRLIDACSSAFSSVLLCSDLVLSGGNTYLAQTAIGYIEETQKCLNQLVDYEISPPNDPRDFDEDFEYINQAIRTIALVSEEQRANTSIALENYQEASERVVIFLTTAGIHAKQESLYRQENAKKLWKLFFALTFIISLIFFVIILITWRRQTKILAHPIQELAEQARDAVSIESYQRPPEFSVQTNIAEVDQLRNDFAIFAERLYKNQHGLEEVVRERTVELSNALDVAVRASQTKTTFLANMSHELRTPLNAIIGYSELSVEELEELPKSPETDEIIRYIQQINKSGFNLLTQINDILDISKIENGKVDLNITVFELKPLIEEILLEVQVLAVKKNNTLSFIPGKDVALLKGDRDKIRQILVNLVGNACKFTNGGEVKITAVDENSPNGHWAIISVSDNGIGIDSQDIEGLFEPYEQRGTSKRQREKGTGLGLAISKRLCQLHGGNITVESELDVGSIFNVNLPVANAV